MLKLKGFTRWWVCYVNTKSGKEKRDHEGGMKEKVLKNSRLTWRVGGEWDETTGTR